MLCNDVRTLFDPLWDGEETPEVRQHLTQCPACVRYCRDLKLVRAGFRLWQAEPVVEPSVGFAARLVRQLGEIGRTPSLAEFFEYVGRRVVYATLVLTFLALMALVLPASGPVRGLTSADLQAASQEAVLMNLDPMGEIAPLESPDAAAAEPTTAPAGTNEVQ